MSDRQGGRSCNCLECTKSLDMEVFSGSECEPARSRSREWEVRRAAMTRLPSSSSRRILIFETGPAFPKMSCNMFKSRGICESHVLEFSNVTCQKSPSLLKSLRLRLPIPTPSAPACSQFRARSSVPSWCTMRFVFVRTVVPMAV
jgi:hypothetical protein